MQHFRACVDVWGCAARAQPGRNEKAGEEAGETVGGEKRVPATIKKEAYY
jgi:hypothetical protein